MKKILSLLAVITLGIFGFTSCYNNKYDLLSSSLSNVSFVNEVVPIMTSGACGCHNSEDQASNWVQFSDGHNEIHYDAILSRSGVLGAWANGTKVHPGGGSVILSERDKLVLKNWVDQGAKSDYTAPEVTGNVTYAANIAPMIKTTCNGGSCHGGAAKTLDYATLTSSSNISKLTQMANSGGSAGHPGGSITLSSSVTGLILKWITQGVKQ